MMMMMMMMMMTHFQLNKHINKASLMTFNKYYV